MRKLAPLLILLVLSQTGCKSFHRQDEHQARRPAVEMFLHGRPSLPAERAADAPLADSYWNKKYRMRDPVYRDPKSWTGD
jgi:hypothetical protein